MSTMSENKSVSPRLCRYPDRSSSSSSSSSSSLSSLTEHEPSTDVDFIAGINVVLHADPRIASLQQRWMKAKEELTEAELDHNAVEEEMVGTESGWWYRTFLQQRQDYSDSRLEIEDKWRPYVASRDVSSIEDLLDKYKDVRRSCQSTLELHQQECANLQAAIGTTVDQPIPNIEGVTSLYWGSIRRALQAASDVAQSNVIDTEEKLATAQLDVEVIQHDVDDLKEQWTKNQAHAALVTNWPILARLARVKRIEDEKRAIFESIEQEH